MAYVQMEKSAGCALLTIDRPQVLNALSPAVLTELAAAVEETKQATDVKAVVITGAGNKAFVAGADIAAMKEMSPAEARAFAQLGHRVMDAVAALPYPVIAAVNGYALGGGCELALACDLRLAASTARFGQPEVKLGIIPGFGGTQRLARLVGSGWAAQLIYSGEMIDAETALKIGLVNAVVPPEQLLTAARTLAEKIAANGPIAVRLAKEALQAGLEMPLAQGCRHEVALFTTCFTTEDQDIGMGAFLQKEKPVFRGV